MQTEYSLPQEWIDYLVNEPETAMGYQMCDIYFTDDTLIDIPVMNCEVFYHDDDSLNLDDIVDIVVKDTGAVRFLGQSP